MDLAVLFGLVSALCYGTGDYVWQVAGRALGVWRSSFYGSVVGVAALSLWLSLAPSLARAALTAPRGAWAAALASAVLLETGSVLLTQGLVRGSLAVVAPVTAGYAAVATVLSVASGERLAGTVAAGLALILCGACIVAIPRRPLAGTGSHGSHTGSGLGWAVGAALAYGGGVWLQGAFAVPALGAIVSVWVMYTVGVVLLAAIGRAARISLSLPERGARGPIVLASALGVGGFVALSAGFATGRLAIVAVLSSLTSAITVLLGRLLSDTRVASYQWLAIATIVAGLMLIKA